MQLKTSYFNKTLFRKNLTRFWPLWGMASFFGGIFPLALLVQILQNFRVIENTNRFDMTEIYYNVVAYGLPIISLCYAILCAMCVWSYLYNARSVGCMHTLPIRREGLFVTNFLSGMVMMAIPYVVTGALCVVVSALAGALELKGLVITILAVIAESFFYFASATVVAFVTANVMTLPVLYFIFHFLAVLLDMLISVFAQGFFYGYRGEFTGVVNFLSPTVFLMEKVRVDNIYETVQQTVKPGTGVVYDTSVLVDVQLENGWIIAVYALVGVALTAAAWLLYQRRRSESAGEVVAVGWMKPVFRYGVSFCGALAGGLLLYYLFWGMYQDGDYYDLLPLVISMAVAGAIGYYIASMLLAKSLRVFKGSWKGLGLVAATVAVVCGIMYFDLLGVESRIPDVEDVESVRVRLNASDYINVTLTEPADVQQVQAAHRVMIENRDLLIARNEDYWYTDNSGQKQNYEYTYLRLNYTLKNGTTMERRYDVRYLQEEVDQPGTAVNALKELYSSSAIQYADILGSLDAANGRILSGELHYAATPVQDSDGYISWDWNLKEINSAQAAALVEAIRRDIDAGSFGRNAFDDQTWNQETYSASISIYYEVQDGENADHTWQSGLDLKFSVNSTNLIAELERQGIITRAELYTEEQVNASEKYGSTPGYIIDGPYSAPAVEDIISGAIRESTAVGIIGGADGPTSVFVAGG